MQEEDSHFNDLKQMVNNMSHNTRTKAPWISDATYILAYQRMALGRKLTANQQERRTATRWLQEDLKEGSRCRVRKSGGYI